MYRRDPEHDRNDREKDPETRIDCMKKLHRPTAAPTVLINKRNRRVLFTRLNKRVNSDIVIAEQEKIIFDGETVTFDGEDLVY